MGEKLNSVNSELIYIHLPVKCIFLYEHACQALVYSEESTEKTKFQEIICD